MRLPVPVASVCLSVCVQYVLRQGYLTKAPDLERGGGGFKRWRRRWFVLHEDGEVIYFENDKVSVAGLLGEEGSGRCGRRSVRSQPMRAAWGQGHAWYSCAAV